MKVIVIHTLDGRAYAGTTELAVVERMLEANVFTAAKSVPEYMRGVAARLLFLESVSVTAEAPDAFLADLIRLGIITTSKGH